jgi:hypothetical protein
MNIQFRQYAGTDDYQAVSEFLIRHHRPGNADGNWLEPAWEYMYFHPQLDSASLDKIGIWEDAGEIVGVCHYESYLGEAFFQFHPAYRWLRAEMLEYAEAHLTGISRKNGKRFLAAFVNDNDPEFLALVQARGYEQHPDATRPLYRFDIPDPFAPISVAA